MTFSILLQADLKGDEEVVQTLYTARELEKNARVKDAFEAAALLVLLAVQDNAPRWLGFLAASFDSEVGVVEEEPAAMVYTDIFQAPVHERGTDPYWPNIDNLEPWAADHGTTAFKVAAAIATRGIKKLKYGEESLRDLENEIVDLLGSAIGQVLEGNY